MKKSFLLLLSACSFFTLSSLSWAAEDMDVVEQSKFMLSILDKSGAEPKDLKTITISRSNPKQEVCWLLETDNIPKQVKVTEFFSAPDKIEFSSPKAITVESSKDQKNYSIVTMMSPTPDGKVLSSCWSFAAPDPLGKYSLQVKVDDMQYSSLNFILVE